MTNKELEQKYEKAFSNAVPNVFDEILEKCNQSPQEKAVIVTMPKPRRTFWRKAVSIAAAIAIILTAGFAGFAIANFESVEAVICFDVNPSIEIEINRDEKIVSAKGSNEDGRKILGEMDLTGSDLSVAVNAIIGSLLRNGYLDEISNSILVSVDSSDDKKSELLEQKLADEINMLLSGESFEASVLSQTLNATKEIRALAAEYGITIGKAQLISQIIEMEPKYAFKDLASLTVSKLNLLISGEDINVNSPGKVTEKKFLSKKKVKQKVLKHAKVSEKSIFDYKCVMDYVSGKVIYVVSFKTDKIEYKYKVNAASGKITSSSAVEKYIGNEAAKLKAFEYVGAIAEEVTEYSTVFANEKYDMSFYIGLVKYYVTVDALLGEVIKCTPNGFANSEILVPYIDENQAKNVAFNNAGTAETDVFEYACELSVNGKIPVYNIKFKTLYDTGVEKGTMDCFYVIGALTGEQLGFSKVLTPTQEETDASQTESEPTSSEILPQAEE